MGHEWSSLTFSDWMRHCCAFLKPSSCFLSGLCCSASTQAMSSLCQIWLSTNKSPLRLIATTDSTFDTIYVQVLSYIMFHICISLNEGIIFFLQLQILSKILYFQKTLFHKGCNNYKYMKRIMWQITERKKNPKIIYFQYDFYHGAVDQTLIPRKEPSLPKRFLLSLVRI